MPILVMGGETTIIKTCGGSERERETATESSYDNSVIARNQKLPTRAQDGAPHIVVEPRKQIQKKPLSQLNLLYHHYIAYSNTIVVSCSYSGLMTHTKSRLVMIKICQKPTSKEDKVDTQTKSGKLKCLSTLAQYAVNMEMNIMDAEDGRDREVHKKVQNIGKMIV